MLKKLDQYMYNLKSPYWEVYLMILIPTLLFSACLLSSCLLFNEEGMLNILGSLGSLVGGIFTFVAVLFAYKTYIDAKNFYIRNLTLELEIKIKVELVTNLGEVLLYSLERAPKFIDRAEKGTLSNEDFIGIHKIIEKLRSHQNELEIKLNYLIELKSAEKEKLDFQNPLLKLANEVTSIFNALEKIKHYPNGANVFLINNVYETDIYKKYLKENNPLPEVMRNDLSDPIKSDIKKYKHELIKSLGLQPN